MRHTAQPIAVEKPSVPTFPLVVASIQFLTPVIFKIVLLTLMVVAISNQVSDFNQTLIKPAAIQKFESPESRLRQEIARTYKLLWGRPASIGVTEGTILGAKSIRTKTIDPVLVAVLLDTECKGKLNAVSPKGYKGPMQTVSATGIPEADIMHGCKMLDEKLAWKEVNPHADLRLALALYKGGTSKQAYNQADEVIRNYKRIKAKLAT